MAALQATLRKIPDPLDRVERLAEVRACPLDRNGDAEAVMLVARSWSALHFAAETCRRYYSALQFVAWSARNAGEAMQSSIFETMGET